MRTLVCCVEEASAKEMLIHVFSKLGLSNDRYKFIVFEGKQDLDKKLITRIKAWGTNLRRKNQTQWGL